jgi:hypothetical protein
MVGRNYTLRKRIENPNNEYIFENDELDKGCLDFKDWQKVKVRKFWATNG